MPSYTERKIFFYRADSGLDDAGNLLPFDHVPILQKIDTLPWTSQGRYWMADDGKVTCCWVDRIAEPSRIRIGNIRREDLPQIEQDGNLSPLGIPAQSGIVEQIHAVFFENNIVGADFNYYGPRLPRLGNYMITKALRDAPDIIQFEALLRQDVAEQLLNLESVRMFTLKVRASYAQTLFEASESLSRAIEAAANAGGAEEVEIILKPTAHSRGWLRGGLPQMARRIMGLRGFRTETTRLKVKGFDREQNKLVELDLLNDKLIAQKSILQLNNRTRALDSDSVYAAIESAHTELRDQLNVASGIRA